MHGVLPVFQTPYLDDESIDFDTLAREVDWLFEAGADGIVMAMVSETLRLADDERLALAQAACRLGRDRGSVVISVGAECTRLAVRNARAAEDAGADAVMAIPPVATAASDGELLRYFEQIVSSIGIPLIVQDASGYVGRPLPLELLARLEREFAPRLLFKPEATPIGPRLSALLEATGGRAKVFEGTGGIALVDSYCRGIVGTMPGADLIHVLVALWQALESGDQARVDAISPPLCAMISLQHSLDAFLAIEKYLLVKQGIFTSAHVRGPVGYVMDEPTRVEVDRLYELLNRIVKSEG